MKNRKAAFEMSITTIVILVIAVIMLILGLVFVRTIMCRGMNMASTTLEGAEREINKLFGEGQGEVSCVGVEQPLNIAPGVYNIVGCGFRYGGSSRTYTYTYRITSAKEINTNNNINTNGWITESLSGSKTTGGGRTAYATFAIRPPEDAPEGMIVIDLSVSSPTGIPSQTIRLNIKRAGFIQKAVC